jgi:hypothetical protein
MAGMLRKEIQMNTSRSFLVFLFVSLFLIFITSGCDQRGNSGGEYDKSVKLPEETRNMEVISAGFATARTDNITANYDWAAFKDEKGDIYVYRQNMKDTVWYKTVMYR